MRDLARLPDEALVMLAHFYKACETARAWPEEIRLCLMTWLSKHTGGCRTVAKSPTVYRLWCGVRKPITKQWEKDHAVDWDTCLPGSSALTAALARSGQAELALLSGDHFVACLWDMTKCFDMVDLPTLVTAAERHEFPTEMLHLALDMHTAPRRLTIHKNCRPDNTAG